jgi:GTPase SAR1 family protein
MEDFFVKTQVDGQRVEMTLWMSNNMEDLDRLRPLSYVNADVVLICFAIDDTESFENVKTMALHLLY